MSFQTALENRTPFETLSLPVVDREGQEALLVVVSATFVCPPGHTCRIAEEQVAVRTADVYRGDPTSSSVLYEADVALMKEFVDVIVNGRAYAPRGGATRVAVRLLVGDIDKTLIVTGDRDRTGRAAPFETMPIIFERAFGGAASNGHVEVQNPVGLGFRGAPPVDQAVKTTEPNIEYPGSGARRPAGLGVVGRGWKPRIDFAGTYDDRWLRSRWPLLPADFDARHYQAAPQDQQSSSIRGGEDVQIANMTPEGEWSFRLPVLDVPMRLLYEDRLVTTPLRMDTVFLEPDRYTVTLTMRSAIRTIRSTPLREVVLGHVTRAWIRARDSRKFYINYTGGDGTDLRRAYFHR